MGNGSNDTSADILVIYQTFGKVSVAALLPGLPIPRKMHLDLLNTSFLQPHNIIFSQIRSGLNLDQFQGNVSGVFQGMDLAYRNVGGLIFRDQKRLFSIGHPGGA
jgi:hypothetical protein